MIARMFLALHLVSAAVFGAIPPQERMELRCPLSTLGLQRPASEYNPHQLVFTQLPIGLGKCLLYRDEDVAEDAGQFFTRLVHDRNKV